MNEKEISKERSKQEDERLKNGVKSEYEDDKKETNTQMRMWMTAGEKSREE